MEAKNQKLKKLPKPAKVAATHALRGLKLKRLEIARILGIGARSVDRYLTEEPDEEWRSFGEGIKKLFLVKEDELSAKALALMEKKMPKAQFRDLVGFYKVIRELRQPKGTAIAVQQADKITYIIQGTKDEDEFKKAIDSSPSKSN